MIHGHHPALLLALLLTAVGMASCAGGPALPGLPKITSGEAGLLTVGSLAGEPSRVPLSSAEVYSRIARGANACWFGPRGRFARTHILHADAAPSSSGGGVDIVVHERASDQPKPWGYKAYRVQLSESPGLDGTPGGGGTSIAVENSRIAEAEAGRMRAEVFQWASGTEGCRADPGPEQPKPVAKEPDPPGRAALHKPAGGQAR